MATITIPKKITKGEELVVVSRKDFKEFEEWKTEIRDILAKIKRGRQEYKTKKTVVADSPRRFR